MDNKLNKEDLVLIRWYGQCQCRCDRLNLACPQEVYLNNRETTTVGFLIAEDDRVLVVASDIHRYDDRDNDMAERIITIPRSLVIDVKKL